MIIGIDFGTCFSSIAVMQGLLPMDNITDKVEQHLGSAAMGIPSLFMYSKDLKKELYGIECLSANPRENPEVIKYMKKKVREDPDNIDKPCPSGGNEYLLRDVIEKYVAYLIKSAKDAAIANGNFSNTDIEAMTITTPIGIAKGQMMASDYNRLIKETMVNITGLSDDDVHIVGEPVAAAISYIYEEDLKKKVNDDQIILVFDLGGGTLDVTVVKHDPHAMEYEILDKEGDLELGGKDWDDALGRLILEKLGIDRIDSDSERGAFWDMITELKIGLSDKDVDVKLINIEGKSHIVQCSRQEFEDATTELINRSALIVKKAVESLEGGINSIDKIVLVGGSSNMPQIGKMIREQFPSFDESNILLYKPSKAIARGAAILAKISYNADGMGLPVKPHVVDSTTNTYGFRALHHDVEEAIYNGIIKGTKFGDNHRITFKSSEFTAVDNNQKTIRYDIYESQWKGPNSVGGNSKDNNQYADQDDDEKRWMNLGNGEVRNGMSVTIQIPPEYLGRARSYSTHVIFDLDQDGILEITIVDKDGNKIGYTTNNN